MSVDPDAVCAATPDCDRGRLEELASVYQGPDDSDSLAPGSYQLLVVTSGASSSFNLTMQVPGGGTPVGVASVPASNVQTVEFDDDDPLESENLWWVGTEREVKPNAVLLTVAAVAGEVKGPGVFEYCLYRDQPPLLTRLGAGELSYATCADAAITAGTRSVTVDQQYTAVLTAVGFPGATTLAGQGAHLLGATDITGHVAVGLWIDPLR
jgi:hypothetical protein